jgi:phage N-6-adenine-methyltransferase
MADFDKRFNSKRQQWSTPDSIFVPLDQEFHFTLDLAADATNAKCAKFYDEKINSLKMDWKGIGYLNPPYGNKKYKLVDWIKKAYQESQKNDCIIVMLIPARTNTRNGGTTIA